VQEVFLEYLQAPTREGVGTWGRGGLEWPPCTPSSMPALALSCPIRCWSSSATSRAVVVLLTRYADCPSSCWFHPQSGIQQCCRILAHAKQHVVEG
jgi:hypothetical protein